MKARGLSPHSLHSQSNPPTWRAIAVRLLPGFAGMCDDDELNGFMGGNMQLWWRVTSIMSINGVHSTLILPVFMVEKLSLNCPPPGMGRGWKSNYSHLLQSNFFLQTGIIVTILPTMNKLLTNQNRLVAITLGLSLYPVSVSVNCDIDLTIRLIFIFYLTTNKQTWLLDHLLQDMISPASVANNCTFCSNETLVIHLPRAISPAKII